MSRKTESDETYGLMYEDDPTLGKTLTLFGALVPWIICVAVGTPIAVLLGASVFGALMFTPWIGLLASFIWIEMNF